MNDSILDWADLETFTDQKFELSYIESQISFNYASKEMYGYIDIVTNGVSLKYNIFKYNNSPTYGDSHYYLCVNGSAYRLHTQCGEIHIMRNINRYLMQNKSDLFYKGLKVTKSEFINKSIVDNMDKIITI